MAYIEGRTVTSHSRSYSSSTAQNRASKLKSRGEESTRDDVRKVAKHVNLTTESECEPQWTGYDAEPDGLYLL
jgi:hypothetical protein